MSGDVRPSAFAADWDTRFSPPAWLAHPHVQSVFSSLPLRRPAVAWRCRRVVAASRDLIVDCGDDVRLLAEHATRERGGQPPADRVAVLLHGWEGSSRSLYMLSLAQYLYDHGYDVVRLNLRDHGGSERLNPGIFHSCRIAEVVGAVRRIQDLNPGRRLCMAGFSLGGNFMLRVAARARGAGIMPTAVVAICPVVEPERTLAELERGWLVYRQYFVWKWHRSLRDKQAAWPDRYDLGEVLSLDTLTEMTDVLARRYGGYPTLGDYLRGYALTGDALATIEHATQIITSADDPIIPVGDFDRLARPRSLALTRTVFGGHCGYYDGRSGATWIEREVLASFEAA